MSLDLIASCTFSGPALPEPFVRFELETALMKPAYCRGQLARKGGCCKSHRGAPSNLWLAQAGAL